MRLAIVGARLKFWPDPSAIRALVFQIVADTPPDTVIISGDSPGGGVDAWARQAAETLGRKFVGHPPLVTVGMTRAEYATACHTRNQTVVDDANEVVAIVAPGSKGTWDAVRRAKKALKLRSLLKPLEEKAHVVQDP